jgi:hypothetical protein
LSWNLAFMTLALIMGFSRKREIAIILKGQLIQESNIALALDAFILTVSMTARWYDFLHSSN